MSGFNLDKYNTWDELLYRASFERSPNDLLYIRKFGRNDDIDSGIEEDIWDSGGVKSILTSAETMSVVSTSANDDLNGSGAWYVQVGGLDSDYNLVTETVTMDGLTPVITTTQFIAVNRVRSVFHGSGQSNAGAITVTGTSSSSLQATIPATNCISQQTHFTVPAGYTCFTTNIVITMYRGGSTGSGARRGEVDQMVYVPDANAQYRTLRYGMSNDGQSFVSNNNLLSQTPAKSTLWFKANAESNNTGVSVSAGYVLVRGDFNFITEI